MYSQVNLCDSDLVRHPLIMVIVYDYHRRIHIIPTYSVCQL